MILSAGNVVDLQYFLMDVAKRYVPEGDSAADLLARAAALDYALLISSESGNETIEDSAPVAALIRETMTQAVATALDFAQTMLAAPDDEFGDFADRHAVPGGLFDVVRDLRTSQAIVDGGIAFRLVTLGSEITERRRRL